MRRTLFHYSRAFKKGKREGFLVRLEKNGIESWGEIAPLEGFSKENLNEAYQDFLTQKYTLPSVQFGYYSALWDINKPLYVPSISIKKKFKVGHLTIESATTLLANQTNVRIDFNRKWNLREAMQFAKKLPSVEYFEEPLKTTEDAKLFTYPVALDESLRARNLPLYPNVVAHIIKPTMHGILFPKTQKKIDFILSSSYESEIGLNQIAKLAIRLKIPLKPMGLATCHLFEEPLFEEYSYIKNNRLHFPKKWTPKKNMIKVCIDEHI